MTADQHVAFAEAAMLIRKPVTEVFDAFINPAITTKFWFTKSSGKLVPGSQVQWTWEMYDHTTTVSVKTVIPNKKIIIEWGNGPEITTVEWTFEALNEHATFVSITDGGYSGDVQKVVSQVRGSTGGFTLVLAGLKAYLEHNIQLNLIGDRFPKGKSVKN
ncbi:uncharacterized protein YndB with AHSA1/START domain [Chitinophaga niastensis]|uniref:Uncharacterized protein YndB with AHSA1/START domain n=1 Tax=Chitinophaga niastensis TaxID=536980 RepID=A0A2P8HIP9_CHINA|nr:SRPBCC family protein [Chitinophaga niastensis]PSL46099.1 uncharacterized protein YndB with AHSA1/START domain [Chitinophaga niastensis]